MSHNTTIPSASRFAIALGSTLRSCAGNELAANDRAKPLSDIDVA
jgi:hypothetical protein